MNKKLFTRWLITCILVIVVGVFNTIEANAAPLVEVPITVTQPNGVVLNLFASGDEFYNWIHDKAGYTIIQDPKTGYYVYADLVEGDLVPTEIVVGDVDPGSTWLTPNLNISPEKMKRIRLSFIEQTLSLHGEIRSAPTTGTINNLVIFIRFSGEAEFSDSTSTYTNMLNSTVQGANSLNNYYREVSYNALTINSQLFPTAGTTIVSYQNNSPRNYYRPYNATTNTIGYQTSEQRALREHTLLRDAINYINGLNQFPTADAIDADNDGIVDSITFIVSGSPDGWSELLWPHQWNLYTYSVTIRGKTVSDYAFQLQSRVNTGVLAHEMFHVLGAPDLYHYNASVIQPVGPWDLMEIDSETPQHMGCYMKFKYGHWINEIPTATSPTTYTLNPLTSSTNNCIKIKSPNSETEFFVVEYRLESSSTFENSLPGSGMLVYRINTSVGEGNADGPPDEVYVYRPGGTPTVNGTVNNANFSRSVGRTEINDQSNPSSFLTDGTAGGLNICNIGESGSTISFDICTAFEIVSPQEGNPAYAGAFNNPRKIMVEVTKPAGGLPSNRFNILIGGLLANIVTMYEGSDKYVLEVMPPVVSDNGLYNLEAIVNVGGVSLSRTKFNSIHYSDAANVDVELVIDRSGSMSGTPLTSAKQAASQFVDFMNNGDMVGVVSFETSSYVNFQLTTIGGSAPDVKQAAQDAISAISSGNMTTIGGGLQSGQDQLNSFGNPNHPWAIVLLTDGEENTAPYVANVLPDIVASKTVVHTVGLGSVNHAQLLDIATQTGGTYNYAPTPDQLAGIYNTISGTVSNQQTLHASTGVAEQGVISYKNVVIDSSISDATFSVSWSDSSSIINLRLKNPNGALITYDSANGNDDIEFISGSTYQTYRIKQPTLTSGVWEMQITGGSFASAGFAQKEPRIEGLAVSYTARVTANSSLTAQFYLDKANYLTREPINLITSLSDNQPILNATVTATITAPADLSQLLEKTSWIEINGDTIRDPDVVAAINTSSTESSMTITLYDDGFHGDGGMNDGVYANTYSGAVNPGSYSFSISAQGYSTSGQPFTRLADLSTYIAENPKPSAYLTFLPVVERGFGFVPNIILPANGQQLNVMQPTLAWQVEWNLNQYTWFKYWISRSPSVSSRNFEVFGWASAFDGSKLITELDPNTIYYWVSAYDYEDPVLGWIDGPHTSVRSFKTGSELAIWVPTVISPADGVQLSMIQPTFSWQVDGNLHPYAWFKYWISRNPDVSPNNNEVAGHASAFDGSKLIIGLDPGTTYYWIAAYDYYTEGVGWKDGFMTPVRSFTTGYGNAIPMPILISPADGSNVDTLIPTINWVVDPAMSNVDCTFVYWYSTDGFATWIYGSAWPGLGNSTVNQNLKSGKTYNWMAQYICYDHYNNQYRGPATDVRTLTTGSGYLLPTAPSLISPANGETVSSNPVTFSWNPVLGAVEYEVSIYYYSGGSQYRYRIITSNTSQNLWMDSNLNYEWEVRAKTNQAWGDTSVIQSFTTGNLSNSSLSNSKSPDYQRVYETDPEVLLPNRSTPVQVYRKEPVPLLPTQN